MPGGDTIMRAEARLPTLSEQVKDALMRAVCARFEHRFAEPRRLPFGSRSWCERCGTNRVVLDADGSVYNATALEIVAAANVEFAEALYEARWGDHPYRPMRVGEWPAP